MSRQEGGWSARLQGRSGRWIQVLGVALLCFGIGYVAAARLLFPAPEGGQELELVTVPEVVGMPVDRATADLQREGLEPDVRARIRHPRAPAGSVVGQSPLPGQRARPGAPVHLTLSAGPDTRRVPDLRGVAPRQAALVLEGLGFEVRTRAVTDGGAFGGVQSTRPEAGQDVSLPAEVELLVAEGPQVVVVPNLEGRHVDDVEQVLEEAGLRLGSVRFDPTSSAAPGRVVAQSPPAGYSLRGGGSVSVEVAGRPGQVGPAADGDAPVESR